MYFISDNKSMGKIVHIFSFSANYKKDVWKIFIQRVYQNRVVSFIMNMLALFMIFKNEFRSFPSKVLLRSCKRFNRLGVVYLFYNLNSVQS